MNRLLDVLMVEDNRVMAEMVLLTIPSLDKKITVHHVKSLTEAVQYLSAGLPAGVVLLDLVLPDAQDIEAVVKIQELYPNLPIVVMSALGGILEEAAMRAGAQDVLDKGTVSPEDLGRILRHAVIRQEVANKYAPVRKSLDETKQVLEEAGRLEKVVQEKTAEN